MNRVFLGALALASTALAVVTAPIQDEGLVRFVNGEVADADDVNHNFDLLATRITAGSDDTTGLSATVGDQDSRIVAVEGRLTTLEDDAALGVASVTALTARVVELEAANEALVAENVTINGHLVDLGTRLAAIEDVLTAERLGLVDEVLGAWSLEDLDTNDVGTARTLRMRGLNLQLVNGQSGTETSDGTGNLILGFAESNSGLVRTGSHNLVLGVDNGYAGAGGIVGGFQNLIDGLGCTILGGTLNRVSGFHNIVVGGEMNTATGGSSVVAGGLDRTADGPHDFVAGGLFETD